MRRLVLLGALLLMVPSCALLRAVAPQLLQLALSEIPQLLNLPKPRPLYQPPYTLLPIAP